MTRSKECQVSQVINFAKSTFGVYTTRYVSCFAIFVLFTERSSDARPLCGFARSVPAFPVGCTCASCVCKRARETSAKSFRSAHIRHSHVHGPIYASTPCHSSKSVRSLTSSMSLRACSPWWNGSVTSWNWFGWAFGLYSLYRSKTIFCALYLVLKCHYIVAIRFRYLSLI